MILWPSPLQLALHASTKSPIKPERSSPFKNIAIITMIDTVILEIKARLIENNEPLERDYQQCIKPPISLMIKIDSSPNAIKNEDDSRGSHDIRKIGAHL